RDQRLDLAVVHLAADQPLRAEHGALRVGHHLALARRADDDVAVGVPRHHRWRGPAAFLVVDHRRFPTLENSHARIRGAEVDPDNAAHAWSEVYLFAASEQLGQSGLGDLEVGIELEGVLQLDARIVEPPIELSLTAAGIAFERADPLRAGIARR